MGPAVRVFVPEVPNRPRHREERPGQHGQRCREATPVRPQRSKNRQRQRNSREHQESDDQHASSVPDREGARTGYRICRGPVTWGGDYSEPTSRQKGCPAGSASTYRGSPSSSERS